MKRPKRLRDPAQRAKLIVDIAAGEVEHREPTPKQARAQKGGPKGGPARAEAAEPKPAKRGPYEKRAVG